MRAALDELKPHKVRGLVLDLRFNPGGLLRSAIEVCNLFISSGRIVSTKGRNTPEHVWDAQGNAIFEGVPMVILVNHYSASASEIVSACLQDHKRAVVMGERTWGKGSVQNIIELEDGRSALKLTTAAYKRPSGKNIHRFPDSKDKDEWGVMPDLGYELGLGDQETRQCSPIAAIATSSWPTRRTRSRPPRRPLRRRGATSRRSCPASRPRRWGQPSRVSRWPGEAGGEARRTKPACAIASRVRRREEAVRRSAVGHGDEVPARAVGEERWQVVAR